MQGSPKRNLVSGGLVGGGLVGGGLVALMLWAMLLWAMPGPARAAEKNGALDCTFEAGARWWTFEKGAFQPAGKSSRLTFAITNIDRKAQTARLETGKGTVRLKIVRALDATHFLEVTVAGYLAITTVYDRERGEDARPAVHSRHLGIVGQPLITQYRGLCRPRK